MKTKSKILLTSMMSIAFASSLIAGSTYALFTSKSEVNIAVTSGKVKVNAEVVENFKLYSLKEGVQEELEEGVTTFVNGGTVSYSEGALTLDRMTPGDKLEFDIKVTNESNVAIKYRTILKESEEQEENSGLLEGLKVVLGEEEFTSAGAVISSWKAPESDEEVIHVSIELPEEAGNEYQDKASNLVFSVEAVQGNASVYDYKASNNEEFVEALNYASEKGGIIKLTADIELDSSYYTVIKDETIINLAGHTLKSKITTSDEYAPFNVRNGGSLTFKNGNLNIERSKASKPSIVVEKNSNLLMDDVTMSSNCYGIFPSGDAASVTIKNSKLISTEAATISTNANNVDNYGVVINVENSTLSGNTGVLVNIPCTVNITGTTIEASMQGIIARGGTFTIKDSNISNTDDDDWAVSYFDTRNWADGNTVNLAALTIGNKGNGYQYPSDVTLINTVVKSLGVYPTVYMYGNTSEGNGATLKYDENCKFVYENDRNDYIIQGDNGANTIVAVI